MCTYFKWTVSIWNCLLKIRPNTKTRFFARHVFFVIFLLEGHKVCSLSNYCTTRFDLLYLSKAPIWFIWQRHNTRCNLILFCQRDNSKLEIGKRITFLNINTFRNQQLLLLHSVFPWYINQTFFIPLSLEKKRATEKKHCNPLKAWSCGSNRPCIIFKNMDS